MTKKELKRRIAIDEGITLAQKQNVLNALSGFSKYDKKIYKNIECAEYIENAYSALKHSFVNGSNKNIFGLFENTVNQIIKWLWLWGIPQSYIKVLSSGNTSIKKSNYEWKGEIKNGKELYFQWSG